MDIRLIPFCHTQDHREISTLLNQSETSVNMFWGEKLKWLILPVFLKLISAFRKEASFVHTQPHSTECQTSWIPPGGLQDPNEALLLRNVNIASPEEETPAQKLAQENSFWLTVASGFIRRYFALSRVQDAYRISSFTFLLYKELDKIPFLQLCKSSVEALSALIVLPRKALDL